MLENRGKEMRVSLITTVLNEASTIDRFLESILSQTRLPDEVVIVDGVSSDPTVERVEQWKRRPNGDRLKVIIDPSCSRAATPGPIGRGRNRAIREASCDLIACADAGCVLDSRWLETIIAPFEDPTTMVAGGWYVPGGDNFFQRVLSLSWIVRPDELNEKNFIPSSRSLAFRRSVWEQVGGYPENSLSSEDTMFIMGIRAAGLSVTLVRDAVVRWELPRSASKFARLIFRYGFGDGFNRIMLRNAVLNAGNLGLAGAFVAAGILGHWLWLAILPLVAGSLAVRRKWRLFSSPEGLAMLPFIGLVRMLSDASYLYGYLRGRVARRHPVIQQIA